MSDLPASTELSEREKEVLRLVATGKTQKLIARQLGISPKTVAQHKHNIRHKLKFATAGELNVYAFRFADTEVRQA